MPCIRLWPDEGELRLAPEADLKRLGPGWEKRYLDLLQPVDRFSPRPLPLAAIYGGTPDPRAGSARVTELGAQAAFVALASHPYPNRGYRLDRRHLAAEFEILRDVADTVPMRAVRFPDGIDRLPATYESLLGDVRTLVAASIDGDGRARVSPS